MDIARLDIIDQVLIMVFVLFIAFIITALLVVTREDIHEWFVKKLSNAVVRMEQFNEWLQDDEHYDAEWMDFQAWKESRI